MTTWRNVILPIVVIAGGLAFLPHGLEAQDVPDSPIVVNEFLPDPATGNEFVEITNNGGAAVDIGGWWIDDIDGGSSPKMIPINTLLAPGSFLVVEFSSVFNNSGDSVRILQANKTTVVFSYTYTASVKGQSYNRQNDGTFVASTTLTPGAENIISSTSSSPTVSPSAFPSPSSSPNSSASPSIAPSIVPTPLPTTIVISEFLPDPAGNDSTDEFIEIANSGDGAVDISGWKLDGSAIGSDLYILPGGSVISSGGFLVFYSAVTKVGLTNTGDTVRLLGPDNAVIFSYSYTGTAPTGKSYNRLSNGTFVTSGNLTPGGPYIEPSASPSPSVDPNYDLTAIVINEFLVNPEGSDNVNEFIELKNISADSVDLSSWQLDDTEGGSKPFIIPMTILPAGGIGVWYRSVTKIALNNNGDTVRLLTPAGQIVVIFTYVGSVKDNQSYNYRAVGEYVLSITPTPGQENVITSPPVPALRYSSNGEKEKKATKKTKEKTGEVKSAIVQTIKLAEVRRQKAGQIFITQGVVSALPGVLGKQIFYVAGSGIQVYLHSAKFPSLAVGDTVQLVGELTSNRGEARLKVADAKDINVISHGPSPSPHPVVVTQIAEEYEGSLVTVTGVATHITKTEITLVATDKKVRVVLQEGANIGKLPYKRGAAFAITGIVSQTTSGYRLLPRGLEDIKLAVTDSVKSGVVGGGKIAGAATKKLTRFPTTGGLIDVYEFISWWWAMLGFILSGFLFYKAHQVHEPLINKLWMYKKN